MNREIRFRFWTPDKIMIDDHEGWVENTGINYALECSRQYGYIAMQYTGLEDDANRGIYESDIIEVIGNGILQYREVYWDNEAAAFMTKNIHFKDDTIFGFSWLKTYCKINVIGNTYEQPLLKKNE